MTFYVQQLVEGGFDVVEYCTFLPFRETEAQAVHYANILHAEYHSKHEKVDVGTPTIADSDHHQLWCQCRWTAADNKTPACKKTQEHLRDDLRRMFEYCCWKLPHAEEWTSTKDKDRQKAVKNLHHPTAYDHLKDPNAVFSPNKSGK